VPVLASRLGTITVTWDGLDFTAAPPPVDFSHLEFYVSATSGGPWAYVDRISGAGSAIVTSVPVGATRYFTTVAVDTSGNDSVRSNEASIVVAGILSPDIDTTVFASIDADIATAKAEALATAAGDATTKANAAQAAATAAAAADATAKADAAEAAATAAAALDAQAKADAAEAAAEAAAALHAQLVADGAEADAIAAAATDATTKANAAQAAATAAAAADATAKANAAQAAATAAAAADAQTKADLAQAAAINSAATLYGPTKTRVTDWTTVGQTTIDGGKITADTVTAGQIAANAITANELAANAVTADEIAAGAVTSDKVLAGAIIAGKLAADAVAANNIQAGAVVAGKLAADSVAASNILAGAVVAGKLAAGAVEAGNIAANAVQAGNIAAGTITANDIASGTLSAAVAVTGSLTAGDPVGSRVVIDTEGVRQYNDGGDIVTNLPTDAAVPSTFEGAIIAQALSVNGNLSIRGTTNEVSEGAEIKLAAGISPPSAAPNVAIGYQTYIPGRWTVDEAWEPVGTHGVADDANIYAAMNDNTGRMGRLIGPSSKYYNWATVTDNAGLTRSVQSFGSMTSCYVGSSERIVTFGKQTSAGNAPIGVMIAWDVFPMNASGTGAPTILAYQPMTMDSATYRTRVGRCFSAIGSSVLRDQICIAVQRDATNDIVLRRYLVNSGTTSFDVQGADLTVTDPLGSSEELAGVAYGSSAKMGFPGTDQTIWVVFSDSKTRVWNTSGVRQTALEFTNEASSQRMAPWGDVATNAFYAFRSNQLTNDTPITKYTNTHWPGTESSVWWISNTWYDSNATGGTHETTQGPRASITMRPRAGLTVTVAPFPAPPAVPTTDDVVAARVYVGRGATDPTRTAMDLVGTPVAPTRTYFIGTVDNVWLPVTTTPPATNGFPTSIPAKLLAGDGLGWSIDGDGKITAGGVLFDAAKPGYTSSAMRTLAFAGDGTQVTTTSTAGIAMGASGAQGTFVAPPSGIVEVEVMGQLGSSTDGQAAGCSFEVKTGATIGSGTVIDAASINKAALCANNQVVRSSQTHLVSGLTPGSTYNIRTILFSGVGTNTARCAWTRLIVRPSP
jgi:hypothetical protein